MEGLLVNLFHLVNVIFIDDSFDLLDLLLSELWRWVILNHVLYFPIYRLRLGMINWLIRLSGIPLNYMP